MIGLCSADEIAHVGCATVRHTTLCGLFSAGELHSRSRSMHGHHACSFKVDYLSTACRAVLHVCTFCTCPQCCAARSAEAASLCDHTTSARPPPIRWASDWQLRNSLPDNAVLSSRSSILAILTDDLIMRRLTYPETSCDHAYRAYCPRRSVSADQDRCADVRWGLCGAPFSDPSV